MFVERTPGQCPVSDNGSQKEFAHMMEQNRSAGARGVHDPELDALRTLPVIGVQRARDMGELAGMAP